MQISSQIKFEQESQKRKLLADNLMPVHLFNEFMDATCLQKFEKTVNNTGQTAFEFYNNQFRKVLKTEASQTLTIDEIFSSMRKEID